MNLTSYVQDRQLTIALRGEIDHHAAREIMQALSAKIDLYLPLRCILDFRDVTFMDSSGIAVVIHTLRRMNTLQGRLLLQNMRGSMTRAAHFHTSVVCLFPDGTELTAEGECPGTIAYAPMGDGGFGYDPVFFVPGLRKTFAQLTAEEKNAISHRGNALRAFAVELKEYLEKN